ncbi:hypothetical protein LPTSP4_05640 [Leptospira ryugenii]|uniref:PASTA domain-containing protein n=1 Tax=Leptospira ryugenii TaxID=1917863 RepID=A0A2P2DWN7_9LEPT|nr:PASTA domain-containing protein [Leptospira ryugenii]GBF49055.1 hypothetical protein LPTSP4_05640 [Leptospira ryugenii]
MKEKFLKILPYSGYVLFLGLGLILFFTAAFLVVVVRTKDEQKVLMPNITGKNYIEVHNELQRLQLKVKLETKRIPEKTDGIVLSQSIDAGKEVEAGSKIYVTVNIGFDRVTVPDVKGQDLKRARAILEKVLSGEIYVPMSIGGITYVPSRGDEPADTVIDQIPQAGKETHSGEKVYLLVTESNTSKSSKVLTPKDWEELLIAVPTPFAVEALQRNKIPYKIQEIQKAKRREDSGIVQSIKVTESGAHITTVFHEAQERMLYDYETVSYEIDDTDVYTAYLSYTDAKTGTEMKREVLTSQKLKEDEMLHLVVYRGPSAKLTLVGLETGEAKTWKWKGVY